MSTFPCIDYIKDGEQVTLKLPDDTDLWVFLAWMDVHFMGMSPEVIAQRRVDEVVQIQQRPKRRARAK